MCVVCCLLCWFGVGALCFVVCDLCFGVWCFVFGVRCVLFGVRCSSSLFVVSCLVVVGWWLVFGA